ncbi:GmrSD restriction endonuclease domain-containing protein [Nocardia sp. IFM 10818]
MHPADAVTRPSERTIRGIPFELPVASQVDKVTQRDLVSPCCSRVKVTSLSVESFEIEKPFLLDLLNQARDGRIQLPEFQRGWVWPEPNIRGLLSSISLGFPVGTLMMLRAGGETRFKQRPLEGVELPATVSAERLLLDGQQRLTSMYQALMLDRPILTLDEKKKPIEGWFYVDMRAALDDGTDREEAFRFVPTDRRVTSNFGRTVDIDLSTLDGECRAAWFPMTRAFDADDWAEHFRELHNYSPEARELWRNFNRQILKRFEQYLIPVLDLAAATPREAVCQVFEKVNTGGVTLTVFELLTATYAADEFDLRKDWERCRETWGDGKYRVLEQVSETDFLQAVTLLATFRRRETAGLVDPNSGPRVGCRRADILRLPLDEYRIYSKQIVEGLLAAAKFLHEQHIFDTRFVPYGTQLIPLAAILSVLGSEWNAHSARQKVARWFWSGVFGELYGSTTETRFARDLPDVVDWALCVTDAEPRTVVDAQFTAGRLRALRSRNSAAYKGIYALLLRTGARDWLSGNSINGATYFDEAVDIHHVFPKAWCARQGIDRTVGDSILNKTPLSAYTNRSIGGAAPSSYLSTLAKNGGVDKQSLHTHVESHLIDPETLRRDDFQRFIGEREKALMALVTEAMSGTGTPQSSPAPGMPGTQPAQTPRSAPATARVNAAQGRRRPWTPADAVLAEEVWDLLTARARGLFSILIDNPGRQYSGAELAELLNLPNSQSTAAVLSRPGTLCAEVQRHYMWSWEYLGDGKCYYWMDDEKAALFRKARG